MTSFTALSVLITILSLIVAAISTIYSLRYAKTNVFHSIQKLMLEKAKECNDIYRQSVNEYMSRPLALGTTRGEFNDMTTTDEVIKSVQLLQNALNEYQERGKMEFFLEQFWIQLDNRVRRQIADFKMEKIAGKKGNNLQEVQNYFAFVLRKYNNQ